MKNKVYFDNAAATQPSNAVLKAIKPLQMGFFGNPSSLHEPGQKSRQAIEQARKSVAEVIGAKASEIIFTSGGTESINLAIQGVAKSYARNYQKLGHIIVSAIEHEAVLECVKALKGYGWQVDYLPVDKHGLVDPNHIIKLVKPNTMLVSVMYANNEVGTIQPIRQIGSLIAGLNRKRNQKTLAPILFHSDACQAGGNLDLDVQKLKVDLLTLNGSKIHGPKGSGMLYVRSGVKLEPIIYGGGQERGLRSGTENTSAIVGFAAALADSQKHKSANVKKLHSLQSQLESELRKIKSVTINGPKNPKLNSKEENFSLTKLPGTINFSVNGVEGEALMLYLDAAGFVVATGSACTTGSTDPSHVLVAMEVKPDLAKSTIRLSLNASTTPAQVKAFIKALKSTIKMLADTKQDI